MAACSWVASANDGARLPGLENLPCGVLSTGGGAPCCGVAIGAFVLDVAALEAAGVITLPGGPLLGAACWNPEVMAAGPRFGAALRARADGAARRRIA
ncbi:MAG: hypothetical protein U1E17_06935 [Geminicoccaceae bacterium]